MKEGNKVLLLILDGWGLSPEVQNNAPLLAKTPTLDYIYATYPKTSLAGSGLEVGLSPGEPGNSEVGHLNIGSGRVVWENLSRINQAIKWGDLAENKDLLAVFDHVKKHHSTLHLWGLVSDGGVHAHIDHFMTIIELASKNGVRDVLVHFVTDGRDTAPQVAFEYVEKLEDTMRKCRCGRIATLIGRFYAMDRDKNWDRVQRSVALMCRNEGEHFSTAKEAIFKNYKEGLSDEYIEPAIIGEGSVIKENDAFLMVNYRSDRCRQMLEVVTRKEKSLAPMVPKFLAVCTMAEYIKNQTVPVLFPRMDLSGTLADSVEAIGLSQYHVAETEKYAHVTYFFNGGREKPHKKENQVIVPSKKVSSYDQCPAMSAREITEKITEAMVHKEQFIVANYANGDMVGHTGKLEPAIKACETVDKCLKTVFMIASDLGYRIILTADHGNCEVMAYDDGTPCKEHTTNPVPFVHCDFSKYPFNPGEKTLSRDEYIQYAMGSPVGILADVAPSVMALLGIKLTKEMAGMDLTVAL